MWWAEREARLGREVHCSSGVRGLLCSALLRPPSAMWPSSSIAHQTSPFTTTHRTALRCASYPERCTGRVRYCDMHQTHLVIFESAVMMGLSSFFLRFFPFVSDEASDFALLIAAFAPLEAILSSPR